MGATLFVQPLDLLKNRMQVAKTKVSLLTVAKGVYAEGGITAIYAGYVSCPELVPHLAPPVCARRRSSSTISAPPQRLPLPSPFHGRRRKAIRWSVPPGYVHDVPPWGVHNAF